MIDTCIASLIRIELLSIEFWEASLLLLFGSTHRGFENRTHKCGKGLQVIVWILISGELSFS